KMGIESGLPAKVGLIVAIHDCAVESYLQNWAIGHFTLLPLFELVKGSATPGACWQNLNQQVEHITQVVEIDILIDGVPMHSLDLGRYAVTVKASTELAESINLLICIMRTFIDFMWMVLNTIFEVFISSLSAFAQLLTSVFQLTGCAG